MNRVSAVSGGTYWLKTDIRTTYSREEVNKRMSVKEAADALKVAENHFNYAEGPFVEAAYYELLAARARLGAAITVAKQNARTA